MAKRSKAERYYQVEVTLTSRGIALVSARTATEAKNKILKWQFDDLVREEDTGIEPHQVINIEDKE